MCSLKKLLDEENYAALKAMGFYPCWENILLDLEYLDEHGMLMALPPESLHIILLGLVPQLIQGYPRHARLINLVNHHARMRIKENIMFYLEKLKNQTKAELIDIRTKLSRQCDPDMPKTKILSGYLIDPDKPDNASTGKKQAHEMRGVLLTMLFFSAIKECWRTKEKHGQENTFRIC